MATILQCMTIAQLKMLQIPLTPDQGVEVTKITLKDARGWLQTALEGFKPFDLD